MSNGINPLEKRFKLLNNIIGWVVFFISLTVLWCTVEPTASFWDCSENLSIYYKLEVGHPPGEPFLQLLQHIFSLLSFGNVHIVAPILNHTSSAFSALSVLFLFWTTSFFARKLVLRDGELTEAKMYVALGAALVAACSFTFLDTFWFSAVEASVWSMSVCFTSFMFWTATKWDRAEDHSERWLILTFFLIGLSIGVHLLCLLFIPAAVFIYYFKTYPNGIHSKFLSRIFSFITKDEKKQGVIAAFVIAVAITGGVKGVVIPGLIKLATSFELFFVNSIGLPFNYGALMYGLILTVLIVYGLYYTSKNNKPGWNTAILAFTVLTIGYSCFLLLVVRANAKPPMNEDSPHDTVSLQDYLDRKQYGDWPVLYGPYFTAPPDLQNPDIDKGPVYEQDLKTGKYVKSYEMEASRYDPKFCTLFTRMWDPNEGHPRGYREWGGSDYEKVPYTDEEGKETTIERPHFLTNNVNYFLRYQLIFMYWRYFLWDFVGKQNDTQCLEPPDNIHGNWITGIPFLDAIRSPQENVPEELGKNRAHAPLYGLPLLLGLAGLYFQFKKDKRNSIVVIVLFFFTGMAILLYLNQAPYQPRERDYSYINSFWAFCIWIGLGVIAIYDLLIKKVAKSPGAAKNMAFVATLIALIVPVVMANAEWAGHDRSKRYTTRDTAIDYLESCAPNAILFTNGDNDTFPLWYAQEVEGIRTDVRVCNLELLGMGWYVDQMNRKAYSSDRMPFSLTHDQYKDGTRDYLLFVDRKIKGYSDLKDVVDYIKSDNLADQLQLNNGKYVNYFPTKKFELKVNRDNVLKSGAIEPELVDSILPAIDWTYPGGQYIQRSQIMVLDALAHNDWKRPIYFAVTSGAESYIGLEKYFQLEGLAYRLVPLKHTPGPNEEPTRINTSIMYNNLVNKFKWGGMSKGVYLDETVRRMAIDMRIQAATLADALIEENKRDSALKVLNIVTDSIPKSSCSYDEPYAIYMIDRAYYAVESLQKANVLAKDLFASLEGDLVYYAELDKDTQQFFSREIGQTGAILEQLLYLAQNYKQTEMVRDFSTRLTNLQKSGALKMQER